jgi:hypothetical protein
MPEHDPNELAEDLEQEADRLERHSGEVQQRLEEAREDWQRKRRDESIPGAPPPEPGDESEDDSPTGAEEEPPPEARLEG